MKEDLIVDLEVLADIPGSSFYDYLLECGMNHAAFDPNQRTRENQIVGCQSQVWISHRIVKEPDHLHFEIDSDSLMVNGVATFIVRAFCHCTAAEAADIKFEDFASLAKKLTYQRQRGIQAMINRVHEIYNALPNKH